MTDRDLESAAAFAEQLEAHGYFDSARAMRALVAEVVRLRGEREEMAAKIVRLAKDRNMWRGLVGRDSTN